MEFGPWTTNTALANRLADILHRHANRLSRDDYAALVEAEQRVRERGDEDE